MNYRIVADSSCDLPLNFLEKDGIDFSLVPLKLLIDGKEFVDDETLDVKAMLNAMRSCKRSSSACPSPEEFAAEFRKNLHTFCVTMSSALSGTHNSAIVGADFVRDENGEAKISIVDSLLTSGGMALMIIKLRDWIKEGLDFHVITEKLKSYQKTLCVRFVLQDFTNLVKAGRMSRVAGVFASVLSICPIMADNGKGEIVVHQKFRGAKLALSNLADTVQEKLKTVRDFPVVITHCDNFEDASSVKNMLLERFGLKDVHIFPMRGLASYYASNKGIIMAF